jgi:hypothetical protein
MQCFWANEYQVIFSFKTRTMAHNTKWVNGLKVESFSSVTTKKTFTIININFHGILDVMNLVHNMQVENWMQIFPSIM